jgi:hypothetical protein
MRISRVGLVAGLFLAAVLLSARPADAQAVFYYRGVHAVPSTYGGFCHIGVRHFHTYKPEDPKVFRYDDNTYIFTGDPTAHGWDGPRVAFYGHHPIAPGWGGGWCFIGGPHYHHYSQYGTSWRWHGGAYYWAGAWTDPWYLRYRSVYGPIYANYYVGRAGYIRPSIYAAPPRFYGGPRVTVPVAAWRGPMMRVNVAGPRVGIGGRVGVGGPRVGVGGHVGGPRVGVGGPGHVGGMPGGGKMGGPGHVGGMPGGGKMGGTPGGGKMGGMPGGGKMGGPGHVGGMPGGGKMGGMPGGGKMGGGPKVGPGGGKMGGMPGGGKMGGTPGGSKMGGMTPRNPPGRGPGMGPTPGRGPSGPAARPAPAPRAPMPAARPAPAPRPQPAPVRSSGGGGRRP